MFSFSVRVLEYWPLDRVADYGASPASTTQKALQIVLAATHGDLRITSTLARPFTLSRTLPRTRRSLPVHKSIGGASPPLLNHDPRHRRDASSMAWRCESYTTRAVTSTRFSGDWLICAQVSAEVFKCVCCGDGGQGLAPEGNLGIEPGTVLPQC